ncbi:DNA repair exonuclease-like protein [Hypomontagnella submonticulosa]|nr:DNA repair exonuclease-like protein [Hypomontagnella submonticulosa]
MDSSLQEIWQTAPGSPFLPSVGKGSQFLVGFVLLLLGLSLTGAFALNRSLTNLPLYGVPASLSIAWEHIFTMTSSAESVPPQQPLFRAVASSTRQIYQLLKCISFTSKVQVQITEDGIRFTADHSRVMQGVAFLDKALFTSYTLNVATEDEAASLPEFQMNLAALLEALQIFGATDVAARAAKAEAEAYRSNLRNYRPDAFNHQSLGMPGTCCIMYEQDGSPLSIILEETGVNTQCNLVTYTPESPDDIPFDRNDLSFKIIMQARWLLDALSELAPLAPVRIAITASPEKPYLSLSSGGGLGSASVNFSSGRDLLETFSVRDHWAQSFKFDFIKSASEAMRIANKVSFRGDGQGVLSLQFMVEIEGGAVSFLDFRFVPYVTQEDEDIGSEEDEDDA